jgi:hypothetical protein
MGKMIELIINKILSEQDIAQEYNLNSTTIGYILISKSPYRNYLHYRFSYIILRGSSPVLCVRFYKDRNSNIRLEREFDIQRAIYNKYTNLKIPYPVVLFEINGHKVMLEEAFDGKTLYRSWEENRTTNNCREVVGHAMRVQMLLSENLIPSNFRDFADEINALTSQFITLYRPTATEEASVMRFVNLLIDEFKNKPIYKRYTNGDFSSRNILLDAANELILLDFEFAEETHLYFLDWLSFVSSLNIPRKTIELLVNDNSDTTVFGASASVKHLNLMYNSETAKALWLLFAMKEFVRHLQAYAKESEIQRITMNATLQTLFTSSNTRTQELIRLARISWFLIQTGGVKIFYHALIEKIRTNALLRTRLASQ